MIAVGLPSTDAVASIDAMQTSHSVGAGFNSRPIFIGSTSGGVPPSTCDFFLPPSEETMVPASCA